MANILSKFGYRNAYYFILFSIGQVPLFQTFTNLEVMIKGSYYKLQNEILEFGLEDENAANLSNADRISWTKV